MPEVEKTSGARVTIRGIGEFTVGDRADVTADEAAYLCDERGDFERVDADDTDDTTDDETDICGAELSDGGTCDRPADECPYHDTTDDETEG